MNLYHHHHSNTSIQSHILTLFYTERLAHFSCLTPLIDAYIDGAGLHYESVSHWDPKTDGSITVKFENEYLICLCTVMGAAI